MNFDYYYLLSVLYVYIYESKNFQFYDKIHKLFQRFRNESFYVKLLVNALHNNPWESKKTAEVEGMDLVLLEGRKLCRNEVYFDRAALLGGETA